jgi:malate dehydrogenase (oxaloacetate-decarboxylating)(NADP+)
MESGVATRPIADLDAYKARLSQYVFQSVLLMKPVFERAKADRRRLVYAEGEDPTVLRAAQAVIDDGLARPILVGRPAVISQRISNLGLRIQLGADCEVVNPESDHRFREYWTEYYALTKRQGITPSDARQVVRTNSTVIASMSVRRGDADALICGLTGPYHEHLKHMVAILGQVPGQALAAVSVVVLKTGTFLIGDTHVHQDPAAATIADIAIAAATCARRFGISPKLALLSHSNFGSSQAPSALKMRDALALVRSREPGLEIDGEMQADAALRAVVREAAVDDSTLHGAANVLIMPNLDAANIAMHLLTVLGEGVTVGPILTGLNYPAHILPAASSVRRIVNMSALAIVDAQSR